MELTAFSDIPPAPVVTPTPCMLPPLGVPTLCSSWPSEIETKTMRPVNEMSDMQNRKKQEQQKDTHLRRKNRSSLSVPQKNSFPIEHLLLSEQTCETNKMYHFTTFKKNHIKITAPKKNSNKQHHPIIPMVAKAPVIWIPSTLVFESWWILLKIPNGSSYVEHVYIYTTRQILLVDIG